MQAQNTHQPSPAHYGDHHEAGNPPEGDPRGYQQHAVNAQPYQGPSTAPHGYSSVPPQQPYAAGADLGPGRPPQQPQWPQAPHIPAQAAPNQYPGPAPAYQAVPQAPPQQAPRFTTPPAQGSVSPYAPQQPLPQQPWGQPQPSVPTAYQQPYHTGPAPAPAQPYPYPYQPAPPQQFAPPQQLPPQPQPFPAQGPLQGPPQGQPPTMDFPPPPNLPPVRDNFINGAGQFLEPGEQVYYGFILKLDDTIEETPRDLMIAIEGQHHTLGEINRASRKVNRGVKWATDPMGAVVDKLVDKGNEALNKKLAGPVFLGGWTSQAGWFIRYLRATAEDYGPGAYGAITSRRYLIFRAARLGGSDMRLVYAVPRTTIAGVRLEGTKNAAMRGRTPRAELHFADGSMVATMMPTKSGERLAAILQVQTQGRF